MLAQRVQKVQPSATLGITAKAKAMKAEGINIVSLGAGEPDFDTPQYIKNALSSALDEGFVYYTPTRGIIELRQAIAEKFGRDNGLTYSPEREILVTPGAKHALYEAVMAVVNPGDEVLLQDPSWVSYEPMVQLADGKPVFVPTHEDDGFRITPEAVSERITRKTKAIIINSPSNPTGGVLRKCELEGIGELCIDHDLIAISDEIYEKILY
ncbi:MAG: aminotransferase class I/II-fold pyridoxal phosphate-dependent enzyme, partial [Candidatus Hydrothermarchaeaceae archaeon]